MEHPTTVKELEDRWASTLAATLRAVQKHPGTYKAVKHQATTIVERPVDIKEYFPIVEKLVEHLTTLDPAGKGSIFQFFQPRITPTTIWQVPQLRMECRDLLDHLQAFDQWRCERHRLHCVK